MDDERRSHAVRAFEDRNAAERAVSDLRAGGWNDEEVGFAMRDEEAPAGASDVAERTAEGAVTGAATGGLIGGIGAAAISLLIPGVGPIIGGGILASVLGGAALGAAAGGLLGALTGLGVSDEDARFYDEEFRSGRPIVTARGSDRYDDAVTIMHRHGGYDRETARTRSSTGGTTTMADDNERDRPENRAASFGYEDRPGSETPRGTTPVHHGSVGPTMQHEEAAEMIQGEGEDTGAAGGTEGTQQGSQTRTER